MDIETTPCLLCGAIDFNPWVRLGDWAYELPGEFQLVKCCNCNHIYQTPRPTQAAIQIFYPDHYQPFLQPVAPKDNSLIRFWRRLQWRARCRQVAQLRRGGRLLDIGASTGLFLNEMRSYGDWTLAGVELNPQAAQSARTRFGLEIFTGQLEETPWPPASFDVITMWDVLEHLPQPRQALLKMRELLPEGGYIIASVPHADSVDARLFGRYWIGLDPPRHLSVFTRAGLRRLFQEAGFEVEATYCFYGRYTTFALSLKQWLHAHLKPTSGRRLIEQILFFPIWRYLTLPYFWLIDQLQLGAIITIRARLGKKK